MDALVRPPQPADELAVEVGDVVEAAARQEARLVDSRCVRSTNPLASGSAGPHKLARPCRACRGTPGTRGSGPGGPGATGRCSPPGPTPRARHRPELAEHLQHAAQHVMRGACRHHPAADADARTPPRPMTTHNLSAWPNPTGISTSGCHRSHCASSPGTIARALTRIRRHEQRAQLRHPIAQDRDPTLPADPLRDHRRRHRRELAPTTRGSRGSTASTAEPVRRPLIARRLIATQRVAHRVPRRPRADAAIALMLNPSARCSRRISAQSSTSITPFNPRLDIEPGFEFQHSKWWTRPEGGQFSTGDRGSVFSRWRHVSGTRGSGGRSPAPLSTRSRRSVRSQPRSR